MNPIEMRRRALQLLDGLRQTVGSGAVRNMLISAEELLWAADELEEISAAGVSETGRKDPHTRNPYRR
jgi:hypothetical protein